jgi:hypothetical protein
MRTGWISILFVSLLLPAKIAFAQIELAPGQKQFREYIFTQDDDVERAIVALVKSAQQGYQPALTTMGDIYRDGRLLPKFTQAFGNPFNDQDLLIEPDLEAAGFWYQLAKDADKAEYDPRVACYLKAKGMLYAEKENFMQVRAAAEHGDTLALLYLNPFRDSDSSRVKTNAEATVDECEPEAEAQDAPEEDPPLPMNALTSFKM